MNDQELAHQIANSVVRDTQFWIAVIGILGVVVGSLATIGGNILLNWRLGTHLKTSIGQNQVTTENTSRS